MAFDLVKDWSAKNVINHVMGVEGGEKYTDIKEDRGGKTRFGVTEELALQYKSLWAKHGFTGDMSKMPESLAYEIYYVHFWLGMNIEAFAKHDKVLAYALFDMGVNGGKGRGIKHVQRFLNVCNDRQKLYPDISADGDFGPKSVAALEAFLKLRGREGMESLNVSVYALQLVFYIELSEKKEEQEKFTYGWIRRVVNAVKGFKQHLFI